MKVRGSILGALLVSGSVFGAVYGAAATLPVNGGTIQAGTDLSLECQTDPVEVEAWGIDSSEDPVTGGKATFVKIGGVNDVTCAGNRLMGRVEGPTGNVVGYLTTLKTTDPGAGTPNTEAAAVTISAFVAPAGANDAHRGEGVYRFQLITPAGSHGIDPDSAKGLRLWIEGPAG
jgi:hypothetical protein